MATHRPTLSNRFLGAIRKMRHNRLTSKGRVVSGFEVSIDDHREVAIDGAEVDLSCQLAIRLPTRAGVMLSARAVS